MLERQKTLILSRLIVLFIAITGLTIWIIIHAQTSWNIFLAVMGFSAVVFVHECGHFFVAKAADIKIEVFSVFIPPVLVGVRRTAEGFRFRILPRFFPKDNDPDGDGLLSFTLKKPGKPGETEYRIGLIPVAGYVKMLGQDDTGADKQSTDPRSFGNKSTGARMAVIAAGVTFNIILALVIMTGVYLHGIPRMAPVVGDVVPGSPAERAGLQPGDRIVEIAGDSDHLDFSDIMMHAALSDVGQEIPMTIQHPDGSLKQISMAAETIQDSPIRVFGIDHPMTLTVADVTDADTLEQHTGLRGDDRVIAVEGQPITRYRQFAQYLTKADKSNLTLTAERTTASGRTEQIQASLPLLLSAAQGELKTESDLSSVYSMVPRLQITSVASKMRVVSLKTGQKPVKPQAGDVILAIDDLEDPTFLELRQKVQVSAGKTVKLRLLRTDKDGHAQEVTAGVKPRRSRSANQVVIGLILALDAGHPVVAKTIHDPNGAPALDLPRGATLASLDGQPVQNFYQLIRALKSTPSRTATLAWSYQGQHGNVEIPTGHSEWITAQATPSEVIPFDYLKEIHQAHGLGEALAMSGRKCIGFVLQTYVTIKQLLARGVSLNAMSGPVGIATLTYQAVEHSTTDFLYLLAYISANLAVVNFLPIPVVDGGVFVLLIVEKLKGGPLSLKIQEMITYAGLALIISLFIYLTYNDIMRLIFG